MLETMKAWVEAGLVISILVVFFGLVARSNVRAGPVGATVIPPAAPARRPPGEVKNAVEYWK